MRRAAMTPSFPRFEQEKTMSVLAAIERTARRQLVAIAGASRAYPAVAIGAAAVGAIAIGAVAIGAVAIGSVAVRRLRVDELSVGSIKIDRGKHHGKRAGQL
jgi:hypothetical protein